MITQGPFDLTIGSTLPLSDPGANSNNPATAVQLQNASPFIIEVNSGDTLVTIQSFTAQTVATSGGGQQMSVEPMGSGASAQTAAPASLTAVWLLAGESSPMIDGSLTAAAISSSLGASGLAGSSGQIKGDFIPIAAGATASFTVPAGNLKLWNLGWLVPPLGTPPTTGVVTFSFPGPSFTGGIDSVTVADAASDRLAGMIFTGNPSITNHMDQTIAAFLVFSPT